MKKIWIFFLCVFLILYPLGPSQAASRSQVDDSAIQIMTLINAYRAENDLYPYACSSSLIGTAQAHTDYQASINDSTHTGSGGTTSSQRVGASGYGGDNAIQVNEMIYFGQFATPEKAVEWWKDSPIHDAIMLSEEYHEIGVGVAESDTHIYYTVNVASITDVTSPSPMGQPLACGEVVIDIPTTPAGTEQPSETGTTGDETETTGGETPVSTQEPGTEEDGSGTAFPTNQLLMIVAGVFFLGVVGFLVIRQFRSRAEFEDELEDEDAIDDLDEEPRESDTSFQRLSTQDQVYALEALAKKVLPEYPLEVVEIEPLRYALNAEYLVTAHAPGDSGSQQKYVLRVNAPGFHTEAEIRSELHWLLALNRATDLIVPNPVPTKTGEWVTSAELPGIPESRHCVLFEYIPGETFETALSPEQLEKVGTFIAKIHHHGAHFSPPDGFTRKHWDLEGLSGGMLDVPVERVYTVLTEDELSTIRSAEKLLAEATDRLGKRAEVYGLIHADIHKKSYLFQGDKAFVLDFDTCGYGYYIYDLAVPMWNLIDMKHGNLEALKAALFRGYRQVRTLSLLEEGFLKNFVAARLMIHTLTLVAHREDPAIRENAAEAIARQFKLLKTVVGIS
jgi:Ser/Thr protein kinase RdoA (MazF antagonist)